MPVPFKVTYRDVQPSSALDALVAKEAEKLSRFFNGILLCRVTIEHAHRKHRIGAPYQANVIIEVPGHDICVNQLGDIHDSIPNDDDTAARVQKGAEVDSAFKDPAFAVRTAFKRARRKLQDYARIMAEPASRY